MNIKIIKDVSYWRKDYLCLHLEREEFHHNKKYPLSKQIQGVAWSVNEIYAIQRLKILKITKKPELQNKPK